MAKGVHLDTDFIALEIELVTIVSNITKGWVVFQCKTGIARLSIG